MCHLLGDSQQLKGIPTCQKIKDSKFLLYKFVYSLFPACKYAIGKWNGEMFCQCMSSSQAKQSHS